MFRFHRGSRQRKSRNAMLDVKKSASSSSAYDLTPITNQFILDDNHLDENTIFNNKDEIERKSDARTPLLIHHEKTKFGHGDKKMTNKWEKVNVQKVPGVNDKGTTKQEVTEEKPMSLRDFIEESSKIFEKYFETDWTTTTTTTTGYDLTEGSTIETTQDDCSVTDISRTISFPNDTVVEKKVTFKDIVLYQEEEEEEEAGDDPDMVFMEPSVNELISKDELCSQMEDEPLPLSSKQEPFKDVNEVTLVNDERQSETLDDDFKLKSRFHKLLPEQVKETLMSRLFQLTFVVGLVYVQSHLINCRIPNIVLLLIGFLFSYRRYIEELLLRVDWSLREAFVNSDDDDDDDDDDVFLHN
jgi:hypothetical protein